MEEKSLGPADMLAVLNHEPLDEDVWLLDDVLGPAVGELTSGT